MGILQLKESRDAGACVRLSMQLVFFCGWNSRVGRPELRAVLTARGAPHPELESCSRHLKLPMSSLAEDCFPPQVQIALKLPGSRWVLISPASSPASSFEPPVPLGKFYVSDGRTYMYVRRGETF